MAQEGGELDRLDEARYSDDGPWDAPEYGFIPDAGVFEYAVNLSAYRCARCAAELEPENEGQCSECGWSGRKP